MARICLVFNFWGQNSNKKNLLYVFFLKQCDDKIFKTRFKIELEYILKMLIMIMIYYFSLLFIRFLKITLNLYRLFLI